ncbi:MAG: BTAD domain-containing putative transcriptional regulator [Caldilineales bacterium]
MQPDQIESVLHISLLGHPRILRGGEPVTSLRAKSQALLFYLAVTGVVQPRSTLASLFWPAADDRQANTSLRTALADLRRLVGDALVTTRQTATLRRAMLHLDVAQFDALLKRTDSAETDALQMQAAVSLYGGDFLDGFSVPDTDSFEQWLAIERARLREAVQDALLSLARWHTDQNDPTAALDHLTRLLAIEPASETGHRQKMALLAAMGNRSAALQQYETCRRVLEQELGVEPSADTVATYELIVSGVLDPAAATASGAAVSFQTAGRNKPAVPVRPPARGDIPDRSAFYGQRDDLAKLARWLTIDGAGLVAISGLGGVGKTSLALELLASLPPSSFDVLLWRSLVNAPPLSAVVDDWLQALAGYRLHHLPENLDDKLAVLLEELKRYRCLLVLDNAESVMEAGTVRLRAGYEDYGQLIETMGQRRTQSCLLVTTRAAGGAAAAVRGVSPRPAAAPDRAAGRGRHRASQEPGRGSRRRVAGIAGKPLFRQSPGVEAGG